MSTNSTNSSFRMPKWQIAILQLGTFGVIWLFPKLPGIVRRASGLLAVSPDWPLRLYPVAHSFLKLHPYIFLCIFSVIFFGPISFILPLVVLQDMSIYLMLSTIRIFHGYIEVWNIARYYYSTQNALDFAPDCLKLQEIFGVLERMAEKYNYWTTMHKSLLVIRVMAAVLALYIVLL